MEHGPPSLAPPDVEDAPLVLGLLELVPALPPGPAALPFEPAPMPVPAALLAGFPALPSAPPALAPGVLELSLLVLPQPSNGTKNAQAK